MDISESIAYQSTGKLLWVGCHFFGAGIGSIAVVKLYKNDDVNVEQASRLYDVIIGELSAEFEKSICFENQSESLSPLRDAYEQFICDDCMTLDDLKKTLPSSSAFHSAVSGNGSVSIVAVEQKGRSPIKNKRSSIPLRRNASPVKRKFSTRNKMRSLSLDLSKGRIQK